MTERKELIALAKKLASKRRAQLYDIPMNKAEFEALLSESRGVRRRDFFQHQNI